MRIFSTINITKFYYGSQIRMLGYTTLTSNLDSDGKHEANYKVWVTQEGTSNWIGVDFCHSFFCSCISIFPRIKRAHRSNQLWNTE